MYVYIMYLATVASWIEYELSYLSNGTTLRILDQRPHSSCFGKINLGSRRDKVRSEWVISTLNHVSYDKLYRRKNWMQALQVDMPTLVHKRFLVVTTFFSCEIVALRFSWISWSIRKVLSGQAMTDNGIVGLALI